MAEVMQPQEESYFNTPLRRSSASSTSLFIGSPPSYPSSHKSSYSQAYHAEHAPSLYSSSAPSSTYTSQVDLSQSSSSTSRSSSSLSLDTGCDDDEDDSIVFPSYGEDQTSSQRQCLESSVNSVTEGPAPVSSPPSEATTTSTHEPLPVAEDDTAIRKEPSRHVDYLSHDWREEDIWSSWRHIVSKRKYYGQRSRLENASWRTWAKSKYKLSTVSPETLNWLKDCDVTWLYGPLQTADNTFSTQNASEPPSHLSKSNSFLTHKKPILKKRSMSEVMLQKSISASSLVKQAAAAVQAQQGDASMRIRDRPIMGRAASDFVTSAVPSQPVSRDTMDCFSSKSTSGLQSPCCDHGERRHIRFDDKVEQCIAVDIKDGEDDDDDDDDQAIDDNDSSDDDDGVVMMKSSHKKRPMARTNSRSSVTSESKLETIAKLAPTTLKYRTDSPEVPESSHSLTPSTPFWQKSKLSPSPSQETLRPSHPSTNFLLEDEDEDADISWEPSEAFSGRRDSIAVNKDRAAAVDSPPRRHSADDIGGGLRRTASGMFMPYEEDEDDVVAAGLFGKVVNAVNTAKDIGHVIWNVGWRS